MSLNITRSDGGNRAQTQNVAYPNSPRSLHIVGSSEQISQEMPPQSEVQASQSRQQPPQYYQSHMEVIGQAPTQPHVVNGNQRSASLAALNLGGAPHPALHQSILSLPGMETQLFVPVAPHHPQSSDSHTSLPATHAQPHTNGFSRFTRNDHLRSSLPASRRAPTSTRDRILNMGNIHTDLSAVTRASSLQPTVSLREFTSPDEMSDMILLVEGQMLHVHRQYVAEWSQVWRQKMLQDMTIPLIIELPGQKYGQVLELLQCIYPMQKPVTDQNVVYLLQLSEEFEIKQLTSWCHSHLLRQPPSLRNLLLAQAHNFKDLHDKCVNYANGLDVSALENSPEFSCLDPQTLASIYKARLCALERNLKKSTSGGPRSSDLEKLVINMRDQQDRAGSVIDTIPKVWENKNKRCYKHMNAEAFDYSCAQCNQRVHLEVRRLCSETHFRRVSPSNRTLSGSQRTSTQTQSSRPISTNTGSPQV